MTEDKHVFRSKNTNSKCNLHEIKIDYSPTLRKLRLLSRVIMWNHDMRFAVFIQLPKLEFFHMFNLICTNILKQEKSLFVGANCRTDFGQK